MIHVDVSQFDSAIAIDEICCRQRQLKTVLAVRLRKINTKILIDRSE
jgi:hypothetical protein